jgi:UDP-N-acetylmuramoyl-tripeptide--D-alanyl-D-alanine ligase
VRRVIGLAAREIAGARLVAGDAHARVHGISIDSRTVAEGDLFAALPGERVDGNDYLSAAVERGAVAVLCRPSRGAGLGTTAVLEAPDVLLALQTVANQVRRLSGAAVVGVAGSAGKTSTKDALRALLAPHRRVVAAHRNHNNELGVPLTLTRIEADTDVCICELAMRGLGQIAELAAIAAPTLGVITNVGPEHLEFLGSVESVAAAQSELLEALPAGSVAVVPDDEPLLEPFLRADLDVRRFGLSARADARVLRFEPAADGTAVELVVAGERIAFHTNLRAPHHRLNLAAAAAAAHALGVPVDRPGEGGGSVELSPHRGQEVARRAGGVVIDDAYNANPASMRAALDGLHARRGEGRLVAVLGEMAELGPDAAALHREIASRATGIDLVVGVGELARLYLDGPESAWFADVDAAADALPGLLQPGDVVLLKASRSVGLERLLEAAS